MEIPSAAHHSNPEKAGYLNKLSGRSFPYIPQWKRRYCVLIKGKLYYYEREDSKGSDKGNGVINLEYFDQVVEASPKESRRATNVFMVTSQDRSFFDPGRYMFSADTLTDMKDWIRTIQNSFDQIRNNSRSLLKSKANIAIASSATLTTAPQETEGERKGRSEIEGEKKMKKEAKANGHNAAKEKKTNREGELLDQQDKSHSTGLSTTAVSLTAAADDSTESSKSSQKKATDSQTASPQATCDSGRSSTGEIIYIKTERVTQALHIRGKDASAVCDGMPSREFQLEAITKHRVKGPRGRRAPQTRRSQSKMSEQRASSMSTLQAQENHATDLHRSAPWLNHSMDLLEESRSGILSSHSENAYSYSSDDDEDEGDQIPSHSDSFITSVSRSGPSNSQAPPPPPPRIAATTGGHPGPPPGPKPLHLPLDSQRSDVAFRSTSLTDIDWKGSQHSVERPPSSSSPNMDDLDNLLMNQSLHHDNIAPLESPSDGSSEVSTCKQASVGTPEKHMAPSNAVQEIKCRASVDLSRFSAAVHHLQRHVVELDHNIHSLSGEVLATRTDLSTLQDAVAAVRSDADRIAEAVSLLSQEAVKASRQVVATSKEMDNLKRAATTALIEAEKSKAEHERLKIEHEQLLDDLKLTLKSLKRSSTCFETPAGLHDQKYYFPDKPQKAFNKAEPNQTTTLATTKQDVKRSGNHKEEISSKNIGYQSFFTRPTSLISGIAKTSLTKSVSFTDQPDKIKGKDLEKRERKGNKEDSKQREKKYDKFTATAERKYKSDKQSSSLEKKTKDKRQSVAKRTKQTESSEVNRISEIILESDVELGIPSTSLDDIPMMDDNTDSLPEKSKAGVKFSKVNMPMMDEEGELSKEKLRTPTKLSKVTINVGPVTNYDIGKSFSSPSVSDQYPVTNRPKLKPLQLGTSTSSELPSLESPEATSQQKRLQASYSPPSLGVREFRKLEFAPVLPLHRPVSTPGPLIRQSSMTTVPEESEILTTSPSSSPSNSTVISKRPGVFAISRQSSSPNLSIQRHNSAPSFPIQRQSSLGTVPEERRLPCQTSLMSVPEEERPIVDRTLPLSPSGSIASFPLSPSSSGVAFSSIRSSMELVTGPVLAGSSLQAANSRELPTLETNREGSPLATSSLKKCQERKRFTQDTASVAI